MPDESADAFEGDHSVDIVQLGLENPFRFARDVEPGPRETADGVFRAYAMKIGQQCLGVDNVQWRNFDVADTIVHARRGAQPQAFLIGGHLYFEGERISDRDFSCAG